MASVVRRIVVPAPTAPPLLALPDDTLDEIFLRLADVARACAACTSFRRVITARPFLRRIRSLHAPIVLGIHNAGRFHPVEAPHRSALAAGALAPAADFTFSFLPEPRRWAVRGTRDGLVLLSRRVTDDAAFHDIAVCDPLRRRYVLVPPVPDDLAASVPKDHCWKVDLFLAPATTEDDDVGDGDRREEMRWPFSVICTVDYSESKAVAFVFHSGDGKWRGIRHRTSSPLLPYGLLSYTFRYHHSYAHGCFFWITANSYSLVLDTREMKFSTMELPLPPDNRRAIVDAEEGMLGLLTFNESTVDLSCKIWRNGVGGAEEWRPYKKIPWPEGSSGKDYGWFSTSAAEVNLLTIRRKSSLSFSLWEYYTLDIRTLQFQRLCATDLHSYLYARFPPLLAPPTI